MQLFRRNVRLVIENEDQNETTTIEKLNVEFDIERTIEKEPSTLRATVYNLSETTRSRLEMNDRVIVSLAAGYGDDLHELFRGDLRLSRTRRDGADIATDIEAGDGEKAAKAWAWKWFPKGASLKSILDYLISKADIGEGNVSDALSINEANGLPDTIPAGRAIRGYALDQMNQLCVSRGIDFSVQDGEAQFLPIGGTKAGVPVVKISPSTGLINSPTIDNEGILSCETLLLPNLFPGSRIDVDSEFVKGRFKIERATYSGSVFGDDFTISIEGKELKA